MRPLLPVPLRRHPTAGVLATGLLGLFVAACASRTEAATGGVVPVVGARAADNREQTADQQVQHALNRLGFGARPGDVGKVRAMGVDRWIALQLQPEQIADHETEQFVTRFTTLGKTGEELLAAYPPVNVVQRLQRQNGGAMVAADTIRERERRRQTLQFLGEVAANRVARAVMSERQLQEVLVDFWENHFNVFAGKDRTRYFLGEYDMRTIRPHAMGSFRELLGAVAKSPAMLYYLDNWQSSADADRPVLGPTRAVGRRPTRRRGVNENYARELMELHTLGVDGGYSQQDVVQVARALTGWTIARGLQGGDFLFRPEMHDAGAKMILGVAFPANRGQVEGEAVLDMLARHPSTARFIATKLARRFVSDTPPAALVQRAATTFTRTNGNIREVVRTILTSDEFFADAAYRAKVKSPFELVVSTMRAMNAAPEGATRAAPLLSRLGQPIYGHQAPNGYPETGDAWMNSGAILSRINFGLAAATGGVPGVRLADWPAARVLYPLPREQQVEGVITELFGGAVSAETRQVLQTGTNPFLEARGANTSGTIDSGTNNGGTMDSGTNNGGTMDSGTSNGGTNNGGRINSRRGAGVSAGRTAADAFAQLVGLALGAPEFQRR